ncbi:MAG: hypothetical protein ABIG70_08380, partial [Pseudomonadota bacterium]
SPWLGGSLTPAGTGYDDCISLTLCLPCTDKLRLLAMGYKYEGKPQGLSPIVRVQGARSAKKQGKAADLIAKPAESSAAPSQRWCAIPVSEGLLPPKAHERGEIQEDISRGIHAV